MRTWLPYFLALPLVVAGGAVAKGARVLPFTPKVDKLPNGLTVVRVPYGAKGLVAYYSAVRVGSRNEVEPGHSGFAHFFEHMMFKGTPKNPEGTRDRLLASFGFDDNASTNDDYTLYHSFGPTAHLDKLIELEADRFQNLAYSEPSFQTEAKAVLGEYNKDASHPDLKLIETLMATAFTRHTYRHTTIGFEADVRKMPEYYEYSKDFFKRWYRPDNVILLLVGDFDDAKAMASIRAHYGKWSGKGSRVAIPAEPAQTAARSANVSWEGPTLPRHVVAWHAPAATLTTKDAAIQDVLSAYLAGPTSPLYKSLVLEKQACESIGIDDQAHRDPGLFTFYAVLKAEASRGDVASALDAAVAELAQGKVDKKRVEDIRSNVRYSLLMGLETADQVASLLAANAAVFGSPDAAEAHVEKVATVTPEDLVAFAQKHLTQANRTVVTLAPKAALEGAR